MEQLNPTQYKLGESPIWNHFNNSLYWVDIENYSVHSYDDHKVASYYVPKKPTAIALIDGVQMFTIVEDGYGILDSRTPTKFIQLHKEYNCNKNGTRLNDAKCDHNGNLWIGSMDRKQKNRTGSLYKLQNSGYLEPVINNIGISNGLAFSKFNSTMYFSDSLTGELWSYTYSNHPSTKKLIHHTNKGVVPDGGTVDMNNKYYSAMWGGSNITVFNHDKIVNHIDVPAKFPTCPCFGGVDMDRLFVTSAVDQETGSGGHVYWMKTDTKGIKETRIFG